MHKETLSKKTAIVLSKLAGVATPFYLAGGTALALHLGHRISIDLDFFTPNDFSTHDLVAQLKEIGTLVAEDQSERTFNGTLDGVKISFFKYPYRLIFPIHDFNGVKIADVRDIAAMKIEAISGRGSKKDFVDLYVLLKIYTIEEILNFFNEKYKECNYNTVHIMRSLTYFYDAETDSEPEYIENIEWKEVKNYIIKVVDKYMKFNN